MGSDKARPAYVEEEDETSGKAVRGTRRSAVSREKPKVSHKETRTGKSRRESAYPAEQSTNLAQHIEVSNKDKAVKLERRGSTSSSTKSPRKSNRPPSAHGNRAFPPLSIPNSSTRPESTYYGIPSPAVQTPGGSHNLAIRPRAQTSQTYPRPSSYYSASTSQGSAGPPLSYSAFYQTNPIMNPSYPPPSPSSSYMRYAATPQPSQPQYSVAPSYQVAGGADYFTPHAMSRPLASRFDPIARTQSAMDTVPRTSSAFGTRDMNPRPIHESYSYEPPGGSYYDDGYTSANEVATIRRKDRRGSIRVPPAQSTYSKADHDSITMPPPTTRPGILRRTTADYSLEPAQDLEYRDTRTQYREEPRPRRPSINRHSVSYDLDRGSEGVRLEPANTGRRRQSWYDQGASSGTGASSAYEDKLNSAANYQEDVGGPTVPLTAEVLRRQQRREAGSSRSTKSSASRDESDYKKSATTRTTRSGSGGDDENVTIKVTGQARVMVGGAQIDCTDGGAIEIKRNQRLGRTGSERSNSEYGENRRIEDRQSRVTRPSARSRMSSQSAQSYTRSPQYPPMDNYI
ncbi:uncharacterized protein LY89DRAFT_731669 [Mollisia scopiformis]|uniref:Uncharacterized protein n=1 Tax=Mollisia scopiformis TaxID=149040 RepID=A0A194XGJ5_MOLSC|nr:uncharacterized protein LY89DRAFT_731669 [Mollisia scopiformis]KUJ19261.1 hypothetical protein LY89DRAFT_731669 [Mollisia scopiformis]